MSWTEEMEGAFKRLKEEMEKEILLSFPDYAAGANRMELYVDASGYGAGACLMQIQDGEHRVIAHNSMSFSEAQRRYSTIDRELAALRWGVKSFRPFLFGVPFILFTDHRPLTFIRNMARASSRVHRTLEDLDDFNFEIRYCRGRDNVAADVLSRLGPGKGLDTELEEGYLPTGLKLL